MYSKVEITPTHNNRFILKKPFRIENIQIPKGYKTNGANIPRIFWWFIPPFKPKYLPAVIVHDYLCDKDKYTLADDLFEKILVDYIENSFRTRIMVKAVRLYHKIKYGVYNAGK